MHPQRFGDGIGVSPSRSSRGNPCKGTGPAAHNCPPWCPALILALHISPADQFHSGTIGLSAPLSYKKTESPRERDRQRDGALGLPQPYRKTPRWCPAGCLSAFEQTKGPGAPDRTTAVEEEYPALDAGPRRAHRLTLFSSAKGLRELYERYSTFMDRFYVGRWKRWVFIERAVGSRHHRARRVDPDAGAGGPGVPAKPPTRTG